MKKTRVHGPRKAGTISVPLPSPVEIEGLGAVFAPKGKKACGGKPNVSSPPTAAPVKKAKAKGGK